MRSILSTLSALLLLPALWAADLHGQDDPASGQDRRPGVAVLPIANGGSFGADAEDLEALEVGLQQLLLTELAHHDSLRIVERSVLRSLLEEQDLGASGRVDASTAADVGRLVGARYVITGVFLDLNGDFHLNTRVVDVETGEILATQRLQDHRDNLYAVVLQAAEEITQGVRLPDLPTQVREARRERQIPAEAITLYSRAQVFEDAGRPEQAAEVYRRIVAEFPDMTEAREALEQISG